MNLKNYLQILICFILLFSITVGYRGNAEGESDYILPENGEHVHGFDLESAMSFFPPDTVMMSVGDAAITWAEFFVFLHNAIAQLSYGFMTELDWNEEFFPGQTISESIMDFTSEHAFELLVFEYAVSELGVALSQEDLDLIQDDINAMIESAESMDVLEESLRDNGFMNLDVFKIIRSRDLIQWLLITTLYGEEISDISDDAIARYVEANDYMRAQHILLAFLSEEDGYSLQEIDDNKAELRVLIEDILTRLNERTGDDDFFDYFERLMWEYSDDPGMFTSPDGYLFQPNDMVEPFSDACIALKPGQVSDIVVTSYGYHIILRLPVNYDEVPFSMMYAGYDYSLRMLAIIDDFESRMSHWRESMIVEYSPQFNSINLSEIFVWCD